MERNEEKEDEEVDQGVAQERIKRRGTIEWKGNWDEAIRNTEEKLGWTKEKEEQKALFIDVKLASYYTHG